MTNLANILREIRDKGWQFDRCHHAFSDIEKLAEQGLALLNVNDGPAPNPRTKGWWLQKENS